jgi:hypothetical protein
VTRRIAWRNRLRIARLTSVLVRTRPDAGSEHCTEDGVHDVLGQGAIMRPRSGLVAPTALPSRHAVVIGPSIRRASDSHSRLRRGLKIQHGCVRPGEAQALRTPWPCCVMV